MKKIFVLLAAFSILTACQGNLTSDVLNAQKEAVEAVNNLSQEAVHTKESLDTRVEQVQRAAESVSEAVDAMNQASADLKALTTEVPTEAAQ